MVKSKKNDKVDVKNDKEMVKKLSALKSKIDKFKKEVLGKFENYILGIALLPPQKTPEGESPEDYINLMVLVDDSDSQKMTKEELKNKLSGIIIEIADKIDKRLKPDTMILTELWQHLYDGKYDLLELIAVSSFVYDKGMLAALKISEVHKQMVLKKFEKYIVSYVLAGSIVQGRATEKSDVDVFIVIDDTDVKKMTRAELKDKLRAIIIGMGSEAGTITGIKNKINIQVYILTDFWDNVKEANPIIFTFLRDGIPLFDKGTFMPWKLLLKMGKVKPSSEAIEMYMSSGDEMLKRVQAKINDIGMEDLFWATLTPSQAALMLFGMPPPTPKETPELMRQIFVKKEKLLEERYVKILESIINVRKNLEHGDIKKITGKEIDNLLSDAEDYLKRINKLFKQIEGQKEKENVVKTYDTVITIVRDLLRLEGIEKVSDSQAIKLFESDIIHRGIMPKHTYTTLKQIEKAKKDYDAGKLTKSEIEKVRKTASKLTKELIEYMQRKRGLELERAKIKVKHGKQYGEVLLLDKQAFIIHDIDQKDKEVSKAPINADGSLGKITRSSLVELEKSLVKIEIPSKVFIKEPIFENLKEVFGKDVEVLINF